MTGMHCTPEMRTPGLTGHEGVRGDDREQPSAER
jgi:hypothetical protein